MYAVNVSCEVNGSMDFTLNYWGGSSGPAPDQITGIFFFNLKINQFFQLEKCFLSKKM
jgi:hypothetical protein